MTYTADQIALKEFIEAENAERQERMDNDPSGKLWIGMVVSDPEHWAGYDIYTIDGYKHYMAACDNFELTREIYGHKPPWNYDSMTIEEIEADTQAMLDDEREGLEQEHREAQALAGSLGHTVEDLKRWGVV